MFGGYLIAGIAPFGLSNYVPVVVSVDGVGAVANPRCSEDGVKVHAPSQAQIRISGTYASILPDAQVAQVRWDDGLVQIDYADGSSPGFCDTIFSANSLTLDDEEYVDWNLYDLSSASNDVGHGDTQDALGLQPCTARVYTMFLKNKAESTGDLLVGDADAPTWNSLLVGSSKLTLPPDSIFVISGDQPAGLAVDPADNSDLRLRAPDGAAQYSFHWTGAST